MRVLIVKLSSMGDLVHALPALSDAARAVPGIEFDWVVDESFAEIPQLHPNVRRIIKSAHRRWGKNKWQVLASGELRNFLRELRKEEYDLVIDAQNNLKSAIITRFCRGLRCGMAKGSGREYGSHLAYQKLISMPNHTQEHAVMRQRSLFAQALEYPLPEEDGDFSVNQDKLPQLPTPSPKPYLVFIHSTTWESKHWPERYWEELIKLATQAGYHVVLPWGNKSEEARAYRLSKVDEGNTTVPVFLSILEKARLINDAEGVITVDTGLGHLTAVLQKPAIHLYGPTDSKLLAIQNNQQKYLSANYPCSPCYLRECKFGVEPECFIKQLTPDIVWKQFVEHVTTTL